MKKQAVSKIINVSKIRLNWRIVWYSVLIWLMGFLVAAIVIIPWYYLVITLTLALTTVYYFKIAKPFEVKRGRRAKRDRDKFFAFGLGAAIAWFTIVGFLTILEIAHLYYFDFFFYFSDFRNWYLLALVLLLPVVYGLLLENSQYKSNP